VEYIFYRLSKNCAGDRRAHKTTMAIAVLDAVVSGCVGVLVGSAIYYLGVIIRTLNRIDRTRVRREGIAIDDGIRKENEAHCDEESTSAVCETKR
jgi:hypothetical protein